MSELDTEYLPDEAHQKSFDFRTDSNHTLCRFDTEFARHNEHLNCQCLFCHIYRDVRYDGMVSMR